VPVWSNSGATKLGGRLPVNLSGGLGFQMATHSLGATGLSMIP